MPRPEGAEPAVGARSEDAAVVGTRRTRLANERTYLAWWRTGLTSLAVSIGTGKIVPELASGSTHGYEAVGVGFAAVGVAFIAYAYVRQRQVEDAIARGDYAPFESRTALVFTALGVVLGIATLVLVLA